MAYLELLKRLDKGVYGDPAFALTSAEADANWQAIEDAAIDLDARLLALQSQVNNIPTDVTQSDITNLQNQITALQLSVTALEAGNAGVVYSRKSANYTTTERQEIVSVDATSNSVIITLDTNEMVVGDTHKVIAFVNAPLGNVGDWTVTVTAIGGQLVTVDETGNLVTQPEIQMAVSGSSLNFVYNATNLEVTT